MSIESKDYDYDEEQQTSRNKSPKDTYIKNKYAQRTHYPELDDDDDVDQSLEFLDDDLNIPSAIKPLTIWWGEFPIKKDQLLTHQLNKLGAEYSYVVKGVLGNATAEQPITDPEKVTVAFLKNLNEFLKENSVTTLNISLGAGISTPVNGKTTSWNYVARLTATFKLDEPGKKRITSIQGVSSYLVQDIDKQNQPDPSLAHAKTQKKFDGYTTTNAVGQTLIDTRSAGSRRSLFAFGYKLGYGTTANTTTWTWETARPIESTKKEQPEKSTNQPLSPTERIDTPEGVVTIGSKIERLSWPASICVPLLLNGKQVGSLIKCQTQREDPEDANSPLREPKTMFMSAARCQTIPELQTCFEKDNDWNYFPNPEAINTYVTTKMPPLGKQRKISMITTWPCFDGYGDPTISGVAYDNGTLVGNETSIEEENSISKWRWIASITWWKLYLEHTSELLKNGQPGSADAQLSRYVSQGRDIMTMPSLIRNGNMNPDASLRHHNNSHSLVTFKDASWWASTPPTRWEVIINGCTPEQKKAIMWALMKSKTGYQIDRALYADADAGKEFLDGIFISDNGKLRYSHPTLWDVFRDPTAKSPPLVKNNMPGIIIHYAEKVA